MVTLAKVRQANKTWFGDGKAKFFGDVNYQILHSEKTGKAYLVRSTYAWSDMFGKRKQLHWRLNPLDECLKIRPLIDDVFPHLQAVKVWLFEN
ncbi:hypothetical protein KAR91_43695 [Candidatus Pacearchaeota archaeon]|nr:hypothetical protein [Candidatus Pacearchaeota archaeon]